VNLDKVAPRFDLEVLPHPNPSIEADAAGELCPLSGSRILPIGANDPVAANRFSVYHDLPIARTRDSDSPPGAYPEFLGVTVQCSMQEYTANANSASPGEISLD
jgi:hypothetical protein